MLTVPSHGPLLAADEMTGRDVFHRRRLLRSRRNPATLQLFRIRISPNI